MRAGATPTGRVTPQTSLPPQAYTPTITVGANAITLQTGWTLKIPGALLVWVTFTSGTGAGGAVSISVPGSYAATAALTVGTISCPAGGINPAPVQVAARADNGADEFFLLPAQRTGFGVRDHPDHELSRPGKAATETPL